MQLDDQSNNQCMQLEYIVENVRMFLIDYL